MSIAQSSMESLRTVAITMPSALSEAPIHFEHPLTAAGGLAITVAATWAGLRLGRSYDTQGDTPYLTEGSSGLTYAVDRFKGWPHSGHVTLARGERSRLADFASEVL